MTKRLRYGRPIDIHRRTLPLTAGQPVPRHRGASGFRHLVAALLASVVVLLGTLAAAAPSGASDASDYVARINALRASVGVQPLAVDDQLTAVAQGWAEHMAATGVLSHSPSLSAGISEPWVKVGENVGVGSDTATIFSTFVGSAAHYRNLVDPAFNRVGVGVAVGGGQQWTCHRFMELAGAGAPAPPPAPPVVRTPAPVPTPRPAPSTTTTTAPPAPVAPAPQPPPPTGPPPPADSTRVATVLSALRHLATDPTSPPDATSSS